MTETTLTTAQNDATAIIDAATRAVTPTEVDAKNLYVTTNRDGERHTLDLQQYLPTPRRKTGTFTTFDAESWLAYWQKHHGEGSEIWADQEKARIVGVLNAHSEGEPGWSDHRLVLTLRHTVQWQVWTAFDNKLLDQTVFAEHVENRLPDFVTPPGAQMLELAQTFQANTKVAFESAKQLASGERQLLYREDTTASAGRKGEITVPREFTVALQPFEGSDAYKVSARLRYRIIGSGQLSIGYMVDRPEDVLRFAFYDVVAKVAAGIDRPVLRGIPA